MHPDKGRSPWPTIEVLVAAANGKISICRLQVHRYRAGTVCQVPDREHTCGVGGSCDGMHVVHRAGSVVHMGEHQNSDLGRERVANVFGLNQLQGVAALAAEALGNVQIGGKVTAFTQHQAPLRRILRGHGKGCCQHFVEIDGGGVGHHHFIRTSADQRRNKVPQALRQVEPARRIPGANQPLAPLLGDHLGRSGGGSFGHHPQRIAIQIDDALGNVELVAQCAQGVRSVTRLAVLQGNHGGASFKKGRFTRRSQASAASPWRKRARLQASQPSCSSWQGDGRHS